jgi:hypothetical protein
MDVEVKTLCGPIEKLGVAGELVTFSESEVVGG